MQRRGPVAQHPLARRRFLQLAGIAAGGALVLGGCSSSGPPAGGKADGAVADWLKHRPLWVAHRGGDADWPQCSAEAYRRAAAWNPLLALEVPVWVTPDGTWVVSEAADTATVFGASHPIPDTPWSTLDTLRSRSGNQPMARLIEDVLEPYAHQRILFIDNKSDSDPSALLSLLARYGGPQRIVMKSYWQSANTPAAARQAGYVTWGYYYARNMADFAATQARYDLLGLDYTAPAGDFRTMLGTGKPVIAHVVPNQAAAQQALGKGANGLMLSGVTQVVPRG